MPHNLTLRPYQSEDDYWRMRRFLREVFLLDSRRSLSWPVTRLDYWRWHGILNLGDGSLENDVFLWETSDGEIVAFLNRESAGQAYLQVHPEYKTAKLEAEMIAVAEERLKTAGQGSSADLTVWCHGADTQRQSLLAERGYTQIPERVDITWRRDLRLPIPQPKPPPGYSLRHLGEAGELQERVWASWMAFHGDEPDERYDPDSSWYLNLQSAPLYRRDLDLVAIAPSGEIAAFITIWYDDATRMGYYEPVGTLPQHQRRGLARALCYEGMHRLKQRGADLAIVGGESEAANALYRAVFGPDRDVRLAWEKRFL
jgi:GNAT superfamily N-acetyltransferase